MEAFGECAVERIGMRTGVGLRAEFVSICVKTLRMFARSLERRRDDVQ